MGDRYETMRAAAYRKKGEDLRNVIIGFDVAVAALPWLLVALILGAGGWFGRRVWMAAGDAVSTGLPGVVSAIGHHWWLWVLVAGAVTGVISSVTSRSFNRWRNIRAVTVVTVVALAALWVVSLFL